MTIRELAGISLGNGHHLSSRGIVGAWESWFHINHCQANQKHVIKKKPSQAYIWYIWVPPHVVKQTQPSPVWDSPHCDGCWQTVSAHGISALNQCQTLWLNGDGRRFIRHNNKCLVGFVMIGGLCGQSHDYKVTKTRQALGFPNWTLIDW